MPGVLQVAEDLYQFLGVAMFSRPVEWASVEVPTLTTMRIDQPFPISFVLL